MPALRDTIADELRQPVLPEAQIIAEHAKAAHGGNTGPILFYGSCLRATTAEGILDLYLLPSSNRLFHGTAWKALLNWLVPPNIYFFRVPRGQGTIQAKVAALSLRQFAQRCAYPAKSTSVWARFCQPAALLHAPDGESRDAVIDALTEAVVTAGHWAALLGPEAGQARDYWVALFRATYAAELRPERRNRPDVIYDTHPERYDRLLPLAWAAAGISFTRDPDGTYRPDVSRGARTRARMAWLLRRMTGKTLSALRLVKGAFTFEGGADYLVWKIERHSGVRIPVSPWQRRHPVLAAPFVFLKLRRMGALR